MPDRKVWLHLLIMRLHAYAGVEPLLLHIVEGHPQVDAVLVVGDGLVRSIQARAHKVSCKAQKRPERTRMHMPIMHHSTAEHHQTNAVGGMIVGG